MEFRMDITLDNPDYYINREFSAIAFNQRVLMLANDERVPLLERMRFLSICSSNLDEFFEIRVAGLKEKIAMSSGKLTIDGLRADEAFSQISQKAHALIDQLYSIFNKQLLPALRKENIHFLETEQWTDDIHLWAKHYFKHEILPVISPIALDLAHPLPRLINKSLNFIISLSGKDAFDRNINYAVVHAPRSIPRMIHLPSELCGDAHYFVYLSSIIKTHINSLFPGMEISGCYSFRLTRNSDLFLREEEIDDLAKAVQREIFSRHYGHVVRLEIENKCPEKIVDFLLQKYHLRHEDTYYCDGPVNLQRYMSAINSIDRPDLNYPAFTPQYPKFSKSQRNLFNVLDEQDILLHHPYQAFDLVIDFVRQAASDPNVLAINQTLYRTHSESVMVDALVNAAHSGKEVTAVIELRARFDEESNLKLANKLHAAGILVLYGVVGYKTHAKMTLVVRRTHGKLKRYVHLSTGNYHEQTAKKYTDLGLLTSEPTITSDAQLIFQQLTGLGKVVKLKALSHSPFTLQKTLLQYIEQCATAATEGIDTEIILKVNGLTDKVTIQALYKASQAGVKINLLVRGVCCLKPGLPGVSENIRVLSFIGRFLEHHRVFYFRINEEEHYFCSSADLMERNLYNRIEIMFPIYDEECQKRIKNEIIKNYLKDNNNVWEMQSDGAYKHILQSGSCAQEKLIALFEEEDKSI
ncbi:TPA: polyphosphate kinase 1 [Legionella pneumophila]|uniref:Polyphosphate kinase n=2 Tax=Legionella pneumophila TaxID=446 RepID=A0A2S6F6Y9_LEGPN|nr:RNA degradosome polyphosphate kinase [Legionella pneumophila subsp. fraseri]AUB67646.1 RNA degradosome polyphosphate kinase [Legionella pneumophila]APF05173.1 RNA degradosome polyphosphate kinase [Legionella pneumophila subsp. fraseri]AUB70617.1 RNA degradosome polyphosphate kinase [Legionella pneumophila]KXB28060.1 polyphosphate kinase [Legionella pneumophila]